MTDWLDKPVLLTGATGFVGQRLYHVLVERGFDVRCASRNPEDAAARYPGRNWVELDVEEPSSLPAAMEDCGSVFYLVHQMLGGSDYGERERRAAHQFRDAAEAAGLRRIVYLGGVAPAGVPSDHLESRLATGQALRSGAISAIELRASMIIGHGSASWRIVRDLAARLPAMILPDWTRTRSQPVWIGDVVEGLVGALELETDDSEWWDLPGPEVMSVEEILRRTARVVGNAPPMFDVPVLSPRLSSYWLRFVTGCDVGLARELVEGLKSDLLAESDAFWNLIEYGDRLGFDEAARRELEPSERRSARWIERVVHRMAPDAGSAT